MFIKFTYILYCKNNKKINLYDYQLSDIKALVSNKSIPVPRLCPQIPERHFPCKVEKKNHKKRYIRKRCRLYASAAPLTRCSVRRPIHTLNDLAMVMHSPSHVTHNIECMYILFLARKLFTK